jgi:hypothetical protein
MKGLEEARGWAPSLAEMVRLVAPPKALLVDS